MFELKLNNKTVQLKWGTWAMREFCVAKGITIDKYFEVLGSSQFDIDNIIKVVYIGYKAACVSNKEEIIYTEFDACDWIDEVGTIFNAEGQLFDYVKYIVETTVNAAKNNNPKKEEKKRLTSLNWDDILVKAAECNIRPSEFWEMTWKDFSIIVMGKEKQELNEWARTRNLAYIVYLSSTTEKTAKSLKHFWHIPEIDDVDEEVKETISTDQLARTLKLFEVI